MQIFRKENLQYTRNQLFVLEKLNELLHNRTLDSYRVRFNNPKSALEELYKLLVDWNNHKIKDFQTVLASKEELLDLLSNDECLNYQDVSKNLLIESVNSLKSGDQYGEIFKLQHLLFYLSEINKDYLSRLFLKIEEQIQSEAVELHEITPLFIRIDKTLNYLTTEIINNGFSKSYLLKFCLAIFVFKRDATFEASWNNFKTTLLNKEEELYCVIFQLNGNEKQLEKINIPELKENVEAKYLIEEPENKIKNYISPSKAKRFISFEVSALDYYQALKKAKNNLGLLLDIIHLGYSNIKMTLKETAVVINLRHKEKADLQPIYYQIDGYYKSTRVLYNTFLEKLEQLRENKSIANEVKDKLRSAIRYLRLGNEAIELEQKFINYWIGLEYIFSDYNIKSSTFSRMKKYFVITHLLGYIKRNLAQLHNEITENGLNEIIEGFDDNLVYFKNVVELDKIINNIETTPLLSHKISRIKSSLLGHTDKRKEYLTNHQKHLEWHFIRSYRIRNELIHEAELTQSIENITSNLRYYLTFILNKLLQYFTESIHEQSIEKIFTMDDFFIHQELIWENIKKEDYSLNTFLTITQQPEFLS